jgi:hypothetical protein
MAYLVAIVPSLAACFNVGQDDAPPDDCQPVGGKRLRQGRRLDGCVGTFTLDGEGTPCITEQPGGRLPRELRKVGISAFSLVFGVNLAHAVLPASPGASSCRLELGAERTPTLPLAASSRGNSGSTRPLSDRSLFASSSPLGVTLFFLPLLAFRPSVFSVLGYPCFDYTISVNQSQGGGEVN